MAFDVNPGSKWRCPMPCWLRYDFGAGKAQVVKPYSITNDVPERDPKDWQFQGSNDGTSWTTAPHAEQPGLCLPVSDAPLRDSRPASYRHYRLNVTANHGDASTQTSELGLSDTRMPQ
jgi:hypothetical protein